MAKKSNFNWAMWILALILITVGFWCLVSGFLLQFNSPVVPVATAVQTFMPWYFAGFLLIGLGKMAKWKACDGMCWKK